MSKRHVNVFKFTVTLIGSNPPIWRSIIVPDTYTFWDLHVAIQDSMGWTDSHLHSFDITNPLSRRKVEIGIPDKEYGRKVLPGWKCSIADYFTESNKQATYVYDFGDNWEHSIVLDAITPREPKVKYPVCIGGARACPPEDCGGIHGYADFLEIIMDPTHEDHCDTLEWVGGSFNPEYFEVKAIVFKNPKKRLTELVGG